MRGSEENKKLREAGYSPIRLSMMSRGQKAKALKELESDGASSDVREAPSTCIKVTAGMQSLVDTNDYAHEGWKKAEWTGVDFKFDTPSDNTLLTKQKVVLENSRGYIPYTNASGIMYFLVDAKVKTVEMRPNHKQVLLAYFGIPDINTQPPAGTAVWDAYASQGHAFLDIQSPTGSTTTTPATPAPQAPATAPQQNEALSQEALKGVDMSQYGGCGLSVYAAYVDVNGAKYTELERHLLEKSKHKLELVSADFYTVAVGGARYRFFEDDARKVLENLGINLVTSEVVKKKSKYKGKIVDLDKMTSEDLLEYSLFIQATIGEKEKAAFEDAAKGLSDIGYHIGPKDLETALEMVLKAQQNNP